MTSGLVPLAMTQYVLPQEPEMSAADQESARRFNEGRYDI
jgi:hypothetical protein